MKDNNQDKLTKSSDVEIDFSKTIAHPGDYIVYSNVNKIKEYYKVKAGACETIKQCQNYRRSFFIYFLFRSGRRVSEVTGKFDYKHPYNPFGNYPGFREEDISWDQNMLKFGILKKKHIKRRDKNMKLKPLEQYQQEIAKKGPKWEWFQFDDLFIASLKKYLVWANNHNMLGTTTDANDKRLFPYARTTANRIIKDASKALKIFLPMNKIDSNELRLPHPHSFRHGYASRAVKMMTAPKDIFALKKMLAHSDIRVTQAYVDLYGGELKSLNEKMFGEKKNG